jgi:signal peptidase I
VIEGEQNSEKKYEAPAGGAVENVPRTKARRWWIAVLFTLLQPGLGQVYNGEWKKAIVLYLGLYIAAGALAAWVIATYPTLRGLSIGCLLGVACVVYWVWDAVVGTRKGGSHYILRPCNRIWIYVLIFVAGTIIHDGGTFVLKKKFIQAFKIPASSMEPAVLMGDYLLVSKSKNSLANLKRGDIVTFLYPPDPTKDFIKRIAGIGGDMIEIRDKRLFVNGKVPDNDPGIFKEKAIISGRLSPRDNFGPIMVPADSFFMLGDNRDRSLDSRFWGFVQRPQVTGLAKAIYFSWDGERSRVRWERLGKRIQ